jgi:hypothetical protein
MVLHRLVELARLIGSYASKERTIRCALNLLSIQYELCVTLSVQAGIIILNGP